MQRIPWPKYNDELRAKLKAGEILQCGWSPEYERMRYGFSGRRGCGAWVYWEEYCPELPEPWGDPLKPLPARIHKGTVYCPQCYRLSHTRHLGQGVMVRPVFEDESNEARSTWDPMGPIVP